MRAGTGGRGLSDTGQYEHDRLHREPTSSSTTDSPGAAGEGRPFATRVDAIVGSSLPSGTDRPQ
jgi:hypothetical protein